MSKLSKRPDIKLYFGNNLGTQENSKNNTLKYYPNPVKNTLTISNSQNITSVELYNISGQQIISTKPENKTTSLDMSNTPPGEYIIKVADKNNSSKNIKIIRACLNFMNVRNYP